MLELIEILANLLAFYLLCIAFLAVFVGYIYIRTIDGLLQGAGWLARVFKRRP